MLAMYSKSSRPARRMPRSTSDRGSAVSGASGDTEPVNAADYFFIGLFNYFIAKRSDALCW